MRIAHLPALIALALTPLAHAAEPASNAPIAVVNGTKIMPQSAALLKQGMLAQGQKDSPDLDNRIRDNLIAIELLSKAAIDQGLDKDPKLAAVLELQRKDHLSKLYLENYLKTHPVTDTDVKLAYDKVKAGPAFTEFKAAHILVKTEAEAKEVLAELAKKGAKFDALAKKYSKDPGSAANGGDLGWADPTAFVPEFSAAMTNLKPGGYTKAPVKTQFGWHIIKLENVRKGELGSLKELTPELTKQLQQLRVREALAEVRKNAKIE